MPSFNSSLNGGRSAVSLVPGRFAVNPDVSGHEWDADVADTNLTALGLAQLHPAVELLAANREVVVVPVSRITGMRGTPGSSSVTFRAVTLTHHDDLIGLHLHDAVGRSTVGTRLGEREPGEDLHRHAEG